MRCQFDVLTTTSLDTSIRPAIVLSYDDKKYLFNCGEGTQRAMVAAKIPIRKIREIFLSFGWDSYGGLGGQLLGMIGDDGISKLGIHGAKNLAYYLATLRAGQQRGFRYNETLDLDIQEYDTARPAPFTDSNLTIQPILAFSNEPTVQNKGSRTTTFMCEKGLLSEEELSNHDRILNVARSVWSGQILRRQGDGIWGPFQTREPHSGNDRPAAEQSKTTDDSTEVEPRNSKRRKMDITADEKDFRPTSEQYRRFSQYMNDDLPGGVSPFNAAVSYYIQGHPLPGKFDPIRARALGVPPGPAYGRLQKGISVRASGGMVHPQDVMGPPRISPPVLIVDCPDLSFLDSLCRHPIWQEYEGTQAPSVILHICGNDVLADPRYVSFMASFGSNVKHLLSSTAHIEDHLSNLKSAHFLETLQGLSPSIYPTPRIANRTIRRDYDTFEAAAINATPLEHAIRFTPVPYLSLSKVDYAGLSVQVAEVEVLTQQYQVRCAEVLKDIAEAASSQTFEHTGGDVEILTLGTGSAGPSGYRNVAATLIINKGDFSTLLDCGEGTLGQMGRAFGDHLDEALQSLRLIFISHMHADHHLGLIGLLRQWMKYNTHNDNMLYIICPAKYARSLFEYANIEDIGIQRLVLINSSCVTKEFRSQGNFSHSLVETQLEGLKLALPTLKTVETTSAIHSERAMCFRFDHHEGWSIAYSGDTRPCHNLVEMAQDVTCLIHEATFENEKVDEAAKKKHSTISEALQISEECRAISTILTHFSQRYPKVPILTDVDYASFSQNRIGLAVDLMRVKIKDIWMLGHHLPPQIELALGLDQLNIKDEVTEAEHLLDDI